MKKTRIAFAKRMLLLAGIIFALVMFLGLSVAGPKASSIGASIALMLPMMTIIRRKGAGRLYKEKDDDDDSGDDGEKGKEKEKLLLKTIQEQFTAAFDKRIKELKEGDTEGKKKLEDLAEQVKELCSKTDLDGLKAELNKLGLKVTALAEKPAEQKSRPFHVALKEAFEEQKAIIDQIVAKNGKQEGPLRINIKAIDMSVEANVEAVGSASHLSITTNTGIISTIRRRIMTYLANVSVGQVSIDRPYAMWMVELDEVGTPIFIGEGDGKTKLSVRYEEREKKAKKIAVYGKVTTEMLRYLPQLISYIQNNIMRRMDIVVENQLFNGNDAGDNLKGILEYAVAFDGGVGVNGGAGLVGLIPGANRYDVLRAVALQVFNSYGVASAIWVTADDLAAMELEKDSTGQYIMPPFRSADGTVIAGMRLIPTNALTGTGYDFVGGDLSVVNTTPVNEVGITIGLDGNDFTQNKKTMLVEQEWVQFVSENDVNVLIKGDFATAITIIDEVVIP